MVVTYTADAVALLRYLVDELPAEADRVFTRAEAGEAVIETPATAVGETLYAVGRDRTVAGVQLAADPPTARELLLDRGPVSVVDAGEVALAEYARLVESFSMHDSFVVATHRARDTEAILTSDGELRDGDLQVVWA